MPDAIELRKLLDTAIRVGERQARTAIAESQAAGDLRLALRRALLLLRMGKIEAATRILTDALNKA